MQLRAKSVKLNAGRPVVILNSFMAEKFGVHTDERVVVKKNHYKTIAVVDTSATLIGREEIAVSSEVLEALNAREGEELEIQNAPKPESLSYIQKKIACKTLSPSEIYAIMQDVVNNALTEAEIAYFVSAVYYCGMSIKETAEMVNALVKTGKTLGLRKSFIVDKHSIGGIAGNRITPIVVAICTALGLVMPKTSSRAITSAAGTADTMETLCRVNFSILELRKIVEKTNGCIVWGGAIGLAPADDKLIQVERLLNLDPEPQLLASIMAKKIAVGSKYILIDIPYGKTAKVTRTEAFSLEKKFLSLSKFFRLKLQCKLTDGSQPIGNGIGPILEMKDVLSVLTGLSVPDLETKSIAIAGKLLEMCGKAEKNKGMEKARKVLESGEAFDQFKEIIKAQKGSIRKLKEAKYQHEISAERSGKVRGIDNIKINKIARIAGSPVDKGAGIYLFKHVSDRVEKGNVMMTLYAESDHRLKDAMKFYKILKPVTIA